MLLWHIPLFLYCSRQDQNSLVLPWTKGHLIIRVGASRLVAVASLGSGVNKPPYLCPMIIGTITTFMHLSIDPYYIPLNQIEQSRFHFLSHFLLSSFKLPAWHDMSWGWVVLEAESTDSGTLDWFPAKWYVCVIHTILPELRECALWERL